MLSSRTSSWTLKSRFFPVLTPNTTRFSRVIGSKSFSTSSTPKNPLFHNANPLKSSINSNNPLSTSYFARNLSSNLFNQQFKNEDYSKYSNYSNSRSHSHSFHFNPRFTQKKNLFGGGSKRFFSSKKETEGYPMFVAAAVLVVLGGTLLVFNSAQETIDWQTFKDQYLATGEVEKLIITTRSHKVSIITRDPSRSAVLLILDIETFEKKVEDAQRELGIQPFDFIPISYDAGFTMMSVGNFLIEMGLLVGLLAVGNMFLRKSLGGGGSQMFSFGKGKHKKFNKETNIKINFKDIAGMDEAKLEIMEFVDFLKTPSRYTRLGAKIPKGAILVGPPGTGKTLLAKATAGQAGVPFFSVSGSDFIEMFVGVGPSRVRDMFADARENSPCIIFIDEIDAVGRARGKGGFTNDERENTLNQLLVEMDGFQSETGVIVLAGTNRPDILDPALLRPGRFDRQIYIENPDIKGRKAIFEIYLKKLKLSDPVEECAKRLASLTPGFSGADIANVCNEGALIAARHNKTFVTLKDLEAAIDRVIGGLERKNRVLSPQEKTIVAYHEAGHAITGWFLEHSSPLLKVSIVPRGVAALGFAQYQPKDNVIYTKDELLDRICMTLGGRIAEQIVFGKISTGAADDLDKVTKLAYAQVTKWGMNPTIGNVSYPDPNEGEITIQKPFSEATGKLIDREVREMVLVAYKRTEGILTERKSELSRVAKRLLEKEVLLKEDMVEILGPRPFHEHTTYEDLTHDHPTPTPNPASASSNSPPPSSPSPQTN